MAFRHFLALTAAVHLRAVAPTSPRSCHLGGGDRQSLACRDEAVKTNDLLDDDVTNLLQVKVKVSAGNTRPAGRHEFGTVDALYTFGAPGSARSPLKNAKDPNGCFQGLRTCTKEHGCPGIGNAVAAPVGVSYVHARMSTLALHWGERHDSFYAPCDNATFGESDWAKLVGGVVDQEGLSARSRGVPRLQQVKENVTVDGTDASNDAVFMSAHDFGIMAVASYSSAADVARDMKAFFPSWKLVKREAVTGSGGEKDTMMIVQNNDSLACALVFAGTNETSEPATSNEFNGTDYCGFSGVHAGYRNRLRTSMQEKMTALRPTLSKCSEVISVGHSLGGALAEIFAACANSGQHDDMDYKRQSWTKDPKGPELLPQVHLHLHEVHAEVRQAPPRPRALK